MEMRKGIEYSQKSWNPFTGCKGIADGTCAVGKNCWAYKMSLRQAGRNGYDKNNPFRPTLHENRLNQPTIRGKPTIYNVSFMGDIAYANFEQLYRITDICNKTQRHRYIFLTKRPDLLVKSEIMFPDNCIVGITVNRKEDLWRIERLKEIKCKYRWVSFEPIYGEIEPDLEGIDWCVVGAQTNPDYQPELHWSLKVIDAADKLEIPVFLKPNLKRFVGRYEVPEMLKI